MFGPGFTVRISVQGTFWHCAVGGAQTNVMFQAPEPGVGATVGPGGGVGATVG